MVDGNKFHALFTDDDAFVRIRQIPSEEIREIHTKPGDGATNMFYRRCWTEMRLDMTKGIEIPHVEEALYPDIHWQPVNQVGSIGGIPVKWDSPIVHTRTGGLRAMKFGFPETYAAIDWARAYRKFLVDWHTIINSLSKFAMMHTTEEKKINDTREKYEEEFGLDEAELVEMDERRGRRRDVGGVAVIGKGDKIAPLPRSGAMTSAEDAKASRLMVASAMNIPDPMLSEDPQQGALATARTLDRPTELGMRFRQSVAASDDKEILNYKIRMAVREGKLAGTSKRIDGFWEFKPNEDPDIKVIFPPILEHDPQEVVTAIVAAATLSGNLPAGTIPRETLSKALMSALPGIEDIEKAMNELPDENDPKLPQNAPKPVPGAPPGTDPEKPFDPKEAVEGLYNLLKEMK